MREKFRVYTDKVINKIGCDRKTAKKIREDLIDTLMMKWDETGEEDPYILMGEVDDIAEEFRENLQLEYKNCYSKNNYNRRRGYYEYKSELKIAGLPLVHVVNGLGVARGIVAIGPVAVGIIALGALSLGVISLGALALGLLFSIGAISGSTLISVGGISIAYYLSFGGISIAKHFAIGGVVIGNVAIGGVAKGIVAVYKERGSGQFVYPYYHKNIGEIMDKIKILYPNINSIVSKIIESLIKIM
ncbi:MAG: hypothetical protein AB2417_18135 [Clostridiaceae bacterium]